MLVSVVMINWNRKADVLRAIKSLKDQTFPDIEIIVVDNHSEDGSQQAIRERHPEVRLIELPAPDPNACRTFNMGMEAAKGDIIAGMDNDAAFETHWVENAIRHFRENPEVGALASKIVNINKEHFYFQYESWPDYYDRDEYDIYTFRGCGFAVRREVMKAAGLYPAEFEIYANEDDYAARIWAAGWRIRYFSDLSANHYTSPVQRPGWRMVYYTTRNRIWTYLRYCSPMMAVIHIIWALYVEGPPIMKAGQTKFLFKGLWDGLKKLPQLGDTRRHTPRWERIMWRNEVDGFRQKRAGA